MRTTSIRHESRHGCKSNYQSDYYGTPLQVLTAFTEDFNKNPDIVWAKLFDESNGELLKELRRFDYCQSDFEGIL